MVSSKLCLIGLPASAPLLRCSRSRSANVPCVAAAGRNVGQPCPASGWQRAQPVAPAQPVQHRAVVCRAGDQDKSQGPSANSWSVLPSRFNSAYAAIVAGYAALFALQNPYIFAALTVAIILPQNSTTTSLNSLVIFFYESGLFMNFAEAVYCVRLVTWLSILCCLTSFAVFA